MCLERLCNLTREECHSAFLSLEGRLDVGVEEGFVEPKEVVDIVRGVCHCDHTAQEEEEREQEQVLLKSHPFSLLGTGLAFHNACVLHTCVLIVLAASLLINFSKPLKVEPTFE